MVSDQRLLSDEELAQMREQGTPRHYCLAQNRCQLPRLHGHIDAQTEEIARLRERVENLERFITEQEASGE